MTAHPNHPHNTASLRRSTSSASSFATTNRSQSPFQAASHPYGMYPQGTGVARSSSVVTSSTIRAPQRPLSGHHGPAHPYGLYPQNVFEDPDEEMANRPQPIPVGFPGHTGGFHRQIGPDGEEQDIIGPDGHTEQLPPYTRFPDEGHAKTAFTPLTVTTSNVDNGAETTNSNDTLVPNGGAAVTSPHRVSSTDVPFTNVSIDNGSSDMSEKKWKEKTWREKRKTKVLFGKISFCTVLVVVSVVVIIAIVVGAVIGAFFTKNKITDDSPSATVTVVSTASMFDASVLSVTPTDLPALPTGVWNLPFESPEESQYDCIADADAIAAWSCKIEDQPPAKIRVIGGQTNSLSGISISPMDSSSNAISYGPQIPDLFVQDLVLVSDLDDTQRGPAWHFQTTYDKIVVLRQEDFTAGLDRADKRQLIEVDLDDAFGSRAQVVAGERPWVCIWNSTFVEGFVFVTQNSSAVARSSALEASASTTSSSLSSTSTFPSFTTSTFADTSAPDPTTGPSGPRYQDDDSDDDDDQTWPGLMPFMPRDAIPTDTVIDLFPRVVKVEERRIPGNPNQPYCQEMQLLDDQTLAPVHDENEEPIIYNIPEVGASDEYTDPSDRMGRRKRTESDTNCHCQWVMA
ncbi:hypothetical protein BDY21DRAFT_342983 [Lineolata rhizophorae]|uniref:DUF7820 domain-containing protein n=1 Tax=Lineolata rhizophorae TaxID=578093 RepID=A0A6A6P1E8_9PEZI|nr:hypothetical protein BDY21DRAFT_342983 [Lineolata rhizophorae]